MAYGQRTDLNLDNQRLIELTDSAAAPGVVDWTVVDRIRDDAQATIDGKLFGKYVTPVPGPVPRVLVLWERDIARYFLYSRRETLEMPKVIVDDYQRALRELDRVVENDGNLLGSPRVQAATPPLPSGGGLEDVPRHFGRHRDGLG